MKGLTMAAGVLLAATCARPECVVVAPETRPSYQNARAAVTVGGKPAARLRIHLEITSFPSGKKSEMQLATDADGAITLTGLRAGQNCLTADAEPRLAATMCLDVTVASHKAPTEFPLALTPLPPPPPTLDEMVKQHEKSPIDITRPAFTGTVTDTAGAGISKADIAVYRRGAATKSNALQLQAGDEGNFTAALDPGTYTAVVKAQGFEMRFVEVEIKQDAPKQDMVINLKIGPMC
jgi:Carboxypeptidase regulatory-like domain